MKRKREEKKKKSKKKIIFCLTFCQCYTGGSKLQLVKERTQFYYIEKETNCIGN